MVAVIIVKSIEGDFPSLETSYFEALDDAYKYAKEKQDEFVNHYDINSEHNHVYDENLGGLYQRVEPPTGVYVCEDTMDSRMIIHIEFIEPRIIKDTSDPILYQGKTFTKEFPNGSKVEYVLDVYEWGIVVLCTIRPKSGMMSYSQRRFKFTKKCSSYQEIYKRILSYYHLSEE